MGYIVRQTLSSEPSPAPMNMNVTSMINLKAVSSADPKSVSVSSSEVLSSDPSYNKEKHGVHPAKKVCIARDRRRTGWGVNVQRFSFTRDLCPGGGG